MNDWGHWNLDTIWMETLEPGQCMAGATGAWKIYDYSHLFLDTTWLGPLEPGPYMAGSTGESTLTGSTGA